nr:hypothetical protein B0A51_02614 [Rachicladosporium sp. CCFEE 5018]
MGDFIGATVRVSLKASPGTFIHGRVVSIVPGQLLSLTDVVVPATGERWGNWSVPVAGVGDVDVIGPAAASQVVETQQDVQQSVPTPPIARAVDRKQVAVEQTPVPEIPAQFVDPAIMSYGRSPCPRIGRPETASTLPASPAPRQAVQGVKATESPLPVTPVKSMMERAANALPARNSSPYIGEPMKLAQRSAVKKETPPQPARRALPAAPPVPVTRPIAVTLDGTAAADEDEVADVSGKKTKKRPKRTPKPSNGVHDHPPVMNAEVSRNGNDMDADIKRGKGWRQTPLLQPSPQPSGSAAKSNTRKNRQAQHEAKESQNGWATEEATDIQDMGEFDFEANHKLFDKRQVFDELRQGDTTADEERLVGHNKVARPGTYGGKNLHPTENVLSPKVTAEDVSSDADTEMNFQTGRSSSRHSVTKRKPSRQNTATLTNPMSTSMTSDRGLSRSVTSLSRSAKLPPSAAGAMPVLDRVHSPLSIGSGPTKANGKKSKPPATQAPPTQGPYFSLASSRKPCPVLHPNALATLEDATVARFGLTHDAITETAARCTAELAYDMMNGSSPSRRNSSHAAPRGSVSKLTPLTSTVPSHPVIVILAGDHPTGARAVAAARHLSSRDCKIILAEAPPEVSGTQNEQLAKQLAMLRKLARSGAAIKRGPWRNVSKSIKSLPGPPSLIIDALLAGATYAPTPSPEDTDDIRLMIDWANRSRASVLSVGCPSGISGLDGTATVVEGEPLAVRADQVLALGAPMKGLLEAKGLGERWDVSVADVGINIALMREDAVGFRGKWVVDVGFQEG